MTVTLGESAGAGYFETISNVKVVKYEPVPKQYKPLHVLNTTIPIDFHRPHKSMIGEIHCTSEAFKAFYGNGSANKAYIVPSGDNLEIPYVVVTATDSGGRTWTYRFYGFVPVDDPGNYDVDNEVVTVYPFVAKYMTKSVT